VLDFRLISDELRMEDGVYVLKLLGGGAFSHCTLHESRAKAAGLCSHYCKITVN